MKFLIILLMFIVYARGSIFGELRHVMSSLENSFQKMITDVVTDVRDTIDCTVEAVESALSLGSMTNAVNPKCIGAGKEYQDKNDNRKDSSLSLFRDTSFSGTHDVGDFNRDNTKQNEIPNKKEDENLQDMKYKLAIDDDRLSNIKTFLMNEMEKMSASMKIQFKEIEYDQRSSTDAIIKYINILHNVKHNSKSGSEINEAQRILDGASKILNGNVKNDDSDDEKVNELLTTLEHKSNEDKTNRVQNTFTNLAENNFSSNKHNDSHLSPRTFKDIFSKALGTTSTKDNKEEINQKIEEVKSSPIDGINLSGHNIENNVESMDYESIFDGRHGDSNDALDEATKILEDSKRTNSILNNFFAKAVQSGSSVFDDTESVFDDTESL